MFEAAILTAIGICILLSRLNLKRVVGYTLFWDVGLMALLTWMFIGTYAGMVTGMAAGVLVSAFLTIVKKKTGAERLGLHRNKDDALPRVRWKEVT
jgi:MFS superfamily sulfate permease-like transporter